MSIQLSIVLPTYNECENLSLIVEDIREKVTVSGYEIIIVDDNSSDGTWQKAQQLAVSDPNIHLIRRIHRRGLTSAILEGFLLAKGEVAVVMDADLQHDTKLINQMVEAASEDVDVVIGSRYTGSGGTKGWSASRLAISQLGTKFAAMVLKNPVSDPLSGFFLIKRDQIHELAPQLHSNGFKVLLDILLKNPNLRVKELPYEFGTRKHGESKLSAKVMLDFLDLLLSQTFLARFNIQLVRYCLIGLSGVLVHFLVLFLLYAKLGLFYPVATFIAIEVALISNYIWNNQWTFSEQRFLHSKWWKGLLRYNLACSLGSIYNLGIGWYLVDAGHWWVGSSIFGIWVGVSWNYMANQLYTWKGAESIS